MIKPMESSVPCPSCGNYIQVVLEPRKGMLDLVAILTEGKTLQFTGEAECTCGKSVVASLHITSTIGGRNDTVFETILLV